MTAVQKPDRGVPVPRSSVTADLKSYYKVSGYPAEVHVRCVDCTRRLFDVHFGDTSVAHVQLVKIACSRCKRLNSNYVTSLRGEPVGSGGRWLCDNCSAFLAEIDAIRGRLTLRCRCKAQPRCTVEDVLEVTRRQVHADLQCDEASAEDVPDDTPF